MQFQELCAHLRLDEGFTEEMEAVSAAGNVDALVAAFDASGAPMDAFADAAGGAFSGAVTTRDYRGFMEAVDREARKRGLPLETLYAFTILQLCCRAYDLYAQLGISEKVYFDTMRDISFWSRHCHRHKGVWGLGEFDWFTRHPALRLFRLGALEFEPLTLERELMGFPRGKRLYNVHIPHGADLSREGTRASYGAAAAFFQEEAPLFLCFSWLLDPKLTELLGEDSNIRRFAGDYRILYTQPRSRAAERFLLDGPKEDYSLYPRQTSLQRKVVALLESGGCLGEACGIYQYHG